MAMSVRFVRGFLVLSSTQTGGSFAKKEAYTVQNNVSEARKRLILPSARGVKRARFITKARRYRAVSTQPTFKISTKRQHAQQPGTCADNTIDTREESLKRHTPLGLQREKLFLLPRGIYLLFCSVEDGVLEWRTKNNLLHATCFLNDGCTVGPYRGAWHTLAHSGRARVSITHPKHDEPNVQQQRTPQTTPCLP